MMRFSFRKKSTNQGKNPHTSRQSGYLLLETMITIGILAVGLLGVSAMQLTSLKSGHSAVQKGEAAFLVAAMTDRMRANTYGVYANNYHNLTRSTLLQTGEISNAQERAQYDYDVWRNEIDQLFSLSASPVGSINCLTTTNCILEISWEDSRANSALQNEYLKLNDDNALNDRAAPKYKHVVSVVF